MDDLRRMALFAEVVRHGSMSAAARSQGLSTSAVSQQMRALEQGSGVTLLHRSTRKLTLTDAGLRFAEHCRAMVEAAEQARRQLALAHDAPVGELRIAAPVGFARYVAPALAPLVADHPALSLRLLVDDAMIDLIDARIDLALRAGRLPDSTHVARRLCIFDVILCAAPAYLRRHGTPQSPSDLLAHQWIMLSREGTALSFEMRRGEREHESLRLEARVTSNNQFSVQQMAGAGLGIALLTRADVDEDLRSGRLVQLMPDWQVPGIAVWVVTPKRDNQPAKVRHAVGALAAHLAQVVGAST